MSIWQLALLVGAAVATWRSRNLPRAWIWIAMGAASFVLSTAWQRHGFPRPEVFGSVTNVMIWLVIYHYGRRQWEGWFAACFQVMVAINVIALFGQAYHLWYIPNYWRVVALELFNWAALSITWVAASAEAAVDGHHVRHTAPGRLGAVGRALNRQRRDPPFTRVP